MIHTIAGDLALRMASVVMRIDGEVDHKCCTTQLRFVGGEPYEIQGDVYFTNNTPQRIATEIPHRFLERTARTQSAIRATASTERSRLIFPTCNQLVGSSDEAYGSKQPGTSRLGADPS